MLWARLSRRDLGHDLGLCLLASLAGLWMDGPLAYHVMQTLCTGQPWSMGRAMTLHAAMLPGTTLLMLLAATLCIRAQHGPGAQYQALCRRVAGIAILFLLMLLAMIVGQRLIDQGVAGAMIGMVLAAPMARPIRWMTEARP